MARKHVEYTSGIYCWTSSNGKKYIGKSKKLEFRKKMFLNFHRDYTGGASKIDAARKYYNDEKYWTYEILEECEEDKLKEREEYWIEHFDTFYNGYNSTKGGAYDTEHSKTSYNTLSEACTAMWNRPGFREHQKEAYAEARKNPEVIEHYRQGSLNFYKNHDAYSKFRHASEESRKKQSAAKINKTNTHSLTPLVQLTKNGEFLREWNGAVCASMELSGKKDNHIHSVCNGDRNYTLGYRWLWKEDYDAAIKEGIPILEYIAKKQAMFEFNKKTTKRPMFTVIQCTYSGEYVATYKSMKDANLAMGASRKGGVNRAFSEKKEY